VNAEYFLEQVEKNHPIFEYRHNPFRYDVSGSEIEMGEAEVEEPKKVILPKNLHLKPDILTMRVVPW
jgi:hypothetical protein